MMFSLEKLRGWFRKLRGSIDHDSRVPTFGNPANPLRDRISLDEVAVTRQPSSNTCVPASLDMLLEHHAPERALTNLEFYHLHPTGLNTADAMGFIASNLEAIGLRLVRGSLAEAIASGQPFIAFVVQEDNGHAVLVQSVREVAGIPDLLVRDPARGAYWERLIDFDARLVGDQSVVGYPTVWGKA